MFLSFMIGKILLKRMNGFSAVKIYIYQGSDALLNARKIFVPENRNGIFKKRNLLVVLLRKVIRVDDDFS